MRHLQCFVSKPSSPRRARAQRVNFALLFVVAAGVWLTVQLRSSGVTTGHGGNSISHAPQTPSSASSEPPSTRRRLAATAADGAANLKFDALHWLRYAEADAKQHGVPLDDECDASYGAGFLKKFVDSKRPLCGAGAEARATGPPPGSTSQVECYAYPFRHYGLACESRNLVLNAAAFMGTPTPPGEKEHHKYLPGGGEGSLQLDCRLPYTPKQLQDIAWSLGSMNYDPSLPAEVDGFTASLARDRAPWFKSAAKQVDPSTINAACQSSSGGAVQHPVMFVSRLDPTNPYIHSQSVVQAFLTLAALQATNNSKPYSEMQVVIADWFKPGPFMEVWRRMSAPHPVINLAEQAPQDTNTCFKHAVHAHYVEPGGAFLAYPGLSYAQRYQPGMANSYKPRRFGRYLAQSCPSTLLLAFAHWQRHLFFELLPSWDQAELANSGSLIQSSGGGGGGSGSSSAAVSQNGVGSGTFGSSSGSGPSVIQYRRSIHSTDARVPSISSISSDTRMPRSIPSSGSGSGSSFAARMPNSMPSISNSGLNTVARMPNSVPVFTPSSSSHSIRTGIRGSDARVMMPSSFLGSNSINAAAGPPTTDGKHKRLNVVWLSRAWFSKSMEAGAGLTPWQKSRQINHAQESAIVSAIQQAVLDWNDRACAPPEFPWWKPPGRPQPQGNCRPTNVTFDFRYVEMTVEDLYPDQAFLLFRTGILVGMHGAALNNMMWMRPHRGAVVEIRGGSDSHHRTTALQLGHRHYQLSSITPFLVANAVQEAMDHVASRY